MKKPFVAMVIPIRQLLLANSEALKCREVEEVYLFLTRTLVELIPVSHDQPHENTNIK